MIYNGITDLPPSVSGLTLIQKGKVLKSANQKIASGVTAEEAVNSAIQEVKVLKSITKSEMPLEEMVSYEIIYEPDTPDFHGDWMTKDTLVKAHANYEAAQQAGAVTGNLFHLYDTTLFTIESTWIQKEFDVLVQATGELIKAGSWVAKVKYHDKGLWDLKKAGVVGGLSIQCSAMHNEKTLELTDLNFGIELEEEED